MSKINTLSTIKYNQLCPLDTVYFRIAKRKHMNRSHWSFEDLCACGDHYAKQVFGALIDGIFHYVEQGN